MQLSWPELLGAGQLAGDSYLSLMVHGVEVGEEERKGEEQEQELEGGSGGHLGDQGGT